MAVIAVALRADFEKSKSSSTPLAAKKQEKG
jgi:hypothetical protein